MVIAAPIIGAAAGYAAFAGTAYAATAMSIGWMIGSWVYSSLNKKKNQTFDPGVQELPAVTSSVRGGTIRVLFGTNRVPAVVVWDDNYNVTRNESGGGGGKSGGSGGGKGGGTSEIVYTYKLDMIYHVGFVPEGPYNLTRMWIGNEPINSQSVFAITQQSNYVFNQFTDTDKLTLSFDEGIYFPGNFPEAAQWSYFTSQNGGFPVRWPGTAWFGFKQLNLGGSPQRPAITVEVGPNGDINRGSGLIDFREAASISDFMPTALQVCQEDVIVAAIGSAVFGISITGGAGWTVNPMYTRVQSDVVSVFGPLLSPHIVNSTYVLPGGAYLISGLADSVNGSQNNDYWCLYAIHNDGIEFLSAIRFTNLDRTSESVEFWSGGPAATDSNGMCDIAGDKTYNDPIIIGTFETVTIWKFVQLPSVNSWLTMNGQTLNNGNIPQAVMDVELGGNWGRSSGIRKGPWGWLAPAADPLGGSSGTLVFYFVPKVAITASNNTFIQSDIIGTYDNGAIVRQNFGVIADPTDWSNTATWTFTIHSLDNIPATIHNGDFISISGGSAFPFTDDQLNRDGGIDTAQNYDPRPSFMKLESGPAKGSYLTIFTKTFVGSANNQAGATANFQKVRAFVYNPLTAKYVEYTSAEWSSFDMRELQASYDKFTVDYHARFVTVKPSTNELFLVCFGDANQAGVANFVTVSNFGDIAISFGEDVTPPYIIKNILVHQLFGVYPGREDLIDSTSYELALAYCESENIKVSCQFSREDEWVNHVELCLALYGGFLTFSGGVFKFGFSSATGISGAGTSERTIDNDHLYVENPGDIPVTINKVAPQDTVNKVIVNFFNRDLDYAQDAVEQNDEVDQDLNGIRKREFPPVFVMARELADKIALRTLWTNLYGGDTYTHKLGPKDQDLKPGMVYTLVDSHWPELAAGQKVRMAYRKEIKHMTYEVTAVQELDEYLTDVSSITIVSSNSDHHPVFPADAPLYARAYELPNEMQTSQKLYVGWVPKSRAFGAKLYASADGVTYAPVQTAEPYPVGGRLLSNLGSDPRRPFEENIRVALFPNSNFTTNSPAFYFDETLNEVGADAMHAGAGVLWAGSEMLGYHGVTLVSQNIYKLSRVFRGFGGTNIQAHNSGDFFWKHGGGIFSQNYSEDKIGTTFYFKVVPYSNLGLEYDISSIEANSYRIQGGYFRPQHPPQVQFVDSAGVFQRGDTKFFVGSTINVTVGWYDTARQSGFGMRGFGIDGFGIFNTDPLSHAWRVEVYGSGGLLVHSTVVSTTTFTYSGGTNIAENGAYRFNPAFKVTPFGAYGDAPRTSVLSLELWQ